MTSRILSHVEQFSLDFHACRRERSCIRHDIDNLVPALPKKSFAMSCAFTTVVEAQCHLKQACPFNTFIAKYLILLRKDKSFESHKVCFQRDRKRLHRFPEHKSPAVNTVLVAHFQRVKVISGRPRRFLCLHNPHLQRLAVHHASPPSVPFRKTSIPEDASKHCRNQMKRYPTSMRSWAMKLVLSFASHAVLTVYNTEQPASKRSPIPTRTYLSPIRRPRHSPLHIPHLPNYRKILQKSHPCLL